ncbi:MAG: 50S ribosomal protein L3 [Planctomycetaceae bacterium]
MPVGLLGRKIGQTQVYGEDGALVPVTVIEAGPCVVTQIRTVDRDGYEAVQIGFDDKPRRLASRSERGRMTAISSKRQKVREAAGVELLAKPDCEPKRFIREFRTDGEDHNCEVGQSLTVSSLADLKRVDVIGKTKGRGNAGVMKRHNFAGQRASHGVKRVHRHGGSIGQSADPARVIKGTKMPGRYGGTHVTVRNLKIVRLDEENNMLLVAGAVPGPVGSYVVVRHSKKQK